MVILKEFLYNNLIANSGNLTIPDVIINFLAACVICVLIYISYKMSHSGPVYSGRFNVSIIMITLVTTLVMNVIGNNIALSLGMVGALSIVRFRTAIKDTRDTAYLFWGVAVGICCGVSDYLVAGIGSVIIFMFLVVFGHIHNNERIMAIIKLDNQAMDEVEKKINLLFGGRAVLRVQNTLVQEQSSESIYELSDKLLSDAEKKYGSVIKNLSNIAGVKSISLVRQDDEISQ
ncbi:DUF4956 domain-containing protein [Sinanaerobacter sp. ZZT-01]|uniref:DUF4956 domain-containing protein n=1 Tax=Sinanaerobacter sp. ZZT-01 TaxID=3111540 RepID=UPI002D76CEAC|nr:DUF4956 domain-containing protein [Sinanaerobacter sp. ZZT-01]WRR94953.1 DUF4956 domain-containing protein [Sinanaerobacter sp. ZZT-01]